MKQKDNKTKQKQPSKANQSQIKLFSLPFLFPFCFFLFLYSKPQFGEIVRKIRHQKWPLHRGIRRASRSPPPRTSDESSNSVSSSARQQVWADRFQTINRTFKWITEFSRFCYLKMSINFVFILNHLKHTHTFTHYSSSHWYTPIHFYQLQVHTILSCRICF